MSKYTVQHKDDPALRVVVGYAHSFGNDQIGGYYAQVFEPGARMAMITWGTENELPTVAHLVRQTRAVVNWSTSANRALLQRLVRDPVVDAISRLRFSPDEEMLLADAASGIAS